jgi:hypothetical protein
MGASPVEDAAGGAATAVLNWSGYLKPCQSGIKEAFYTYTSVTFPKCRRHGTVSIVTKHPHTDDIAWNRGREGYLDLPQKPVYAPVAKPAQQIKPQGSWISISSEIRLGSLIAAGGMIWGAYTATQAYAGVLSLDIVRHEPMELCALGILVWLHAKWRRATKVD